ncbi:Cys-tRNA(Pro) deacylase [Clostridiaceae bacterium NSJ-31]|uniref:Cys-tRNA(Pro)/Cys-tRNA(Cys) deacylase n=1 Tax=Ligaoa zhengdingensis TaxID=2763658 RepID=A0A926DYT0_9FIRM|nr:Cys-tRNA(Pro) deacylase [Ligaoa zhengdingensis]MBC8546067.1 Cys-tRNA(Pro) deacylase [Ligaoa zhengdingensis]
MAETKTNVMRILERAKIPYTAHAYDHGDGLIDGVSVAQKLGQDPAAVFKTLVTRGASGAYHVFVIPVAKELNLKKGAKAAGEKSVEMIHVSEINKVTGYIRGGCSPVGMKKQYATLFDSSALAQEHIMVSAGKIGHQVELEPKALADLVGGGFASLTDE